MKKLEKNTNTDVMKFKLCFVIELTNKHHSNTQVILPDSVPNSFGMDKER